MIHDAQSKSMLAAAVSVLRVEDYGTPAQFAEAHRFLKPGTTERPGKWSNAHVPALTSIMDCAGEALALGKNFCLMKSGQGGGSEAVINFLAYLKAQYSGPILYVISKDEIAAEFGRERFGYILDTCSPLSRKALRGKSSGESLHHKRFVDGKLDIVGGRSILNLQSQPYRFVFLDEVDSLLDEVKDQGDPIKIAQVRMDAFEGTTMMLAFAHPTNAGRGVGRLYYTLSDQRRGFVRCIHCEKEIWLSWSHVEAVAGAGLNQAQAERRADRYKYFCPECGVEITDGERWRMIAAGVTQKSTLPPDVAALRPWVGCHFSQLYYPHKTIRDLAQQHVAALDNEGAKIVFVNKVMGDVYEPQVQEVTADQWRRLVCIPTGDNDRESWRRGTVPWGVRFLTAGQDSRSTELHWTVWGWGLRRDALTEQAVLCGRLIDWGVVERKYSLTLDPQEMAVFDSLIYDRLFPAAWDPQRTFHVVQGGHDIGWQQIAVNEYCRRWAYRALPVKGAAETMSSRSTAPAVRPGNPLSYIYGKEKVADERVRPLFLNTYHLKIQLYGMLDKTVALKNKTELAARNTPCLLLPADAFSMSDGERFCYESSNEILAPISFAKKEEFQWKRKGPNHFADCNIYAYACALNLNPQAANLPFGDPEEQEPANAAAPNPALARRAADDLHEKYNRTGDWIAER